MWSYRLLLRTQLLSAPGSSWWTVSRKKCWTFWWVIKRLIHYEFKYCIASHTGQCDIHIQLSTDTYIRDKHSPRVLLDMLKSFFEQVRTQTTETVCPLLSKNQKVTYIFSYRDQYSHSFIVRMYVCMQTCMGRQHLTWSAMYAVLSLGSTLTC